MRRDSLALRASVLLLGLTLAFALAACSAQTSSKPALADNTASASSSSSSTKNSTQTTAEPTSASAGASDFLEPPAYDGYEPVPCFTFHHVDPKMKNIITVRPAMFEAQLKLLKANGFHTITARDVAKHQTDGTPLPDKPVMITFDDGWKNQYVNAAPLLEKYGFTATFFINPQPIGRGSAYMTRAMVESLDKRGFDIEDHTWQHLRLTRKPTESKATFEARANHQLALSDRWIYTVTSKKPVALCYPFGYYDTEVIGMAKAEGYQLCFSTEEGIADARPWDAYAMKRFTMGPNISLADFEAEVNGGVLPVRDMQPAPASRVVGINTTISVDITDVPATVTGLRLAAGSGVQPAQIVERGGRRYMEAALRRSRVGFRQISLLGKDAAGRRYYASWSLEMGERAPK